MDPAGLYPVTRAKLSKIIGPPTFGGIPIVPQPSRDRGNQLFYTLGRMVCQLNYVHLVTPAGYSSLHKYAGGYIYPIDRWGRLDMKRQSRLLFVRTGCGVVFELRGITIRRCDLGRCTHPSTHLSPAEHSRPPGEAVLYHSRAS